MIKGHKPKEASYAEGGAVLGRTREFMKEPDTFRGPAGTEDKTYGKGGDGQASGNPNPKPGKKEKKLV